MNKLYKIIVLGLASATLSACMPEPDEQTGLPHYDGYTVACLDGVQYYKGLKTLAPKYNIDGTLALCIKGDR